MADPTQNLTYEGIFGEPLDSEGLTYEGIFGEPLDSEGLTYKGIFDEQPTNLNLFNQTPTTTVPKTTEGFTYESLGTGDAPTSRGDPNSRTNLFFKSFDTHNIHMYEGIKLMGEYLEPKFPQAGEYLKFFGDKGVEKNKQDLAKRPDTLPPRIPFGDDGYIAEFKQEFDAGNYKPAFLNLFNNVANSTADVAGQLAPIVIGGLSLSLPGRLLFGTGKVATTILQSMGAILPAMLPIKHSSYKEAIDLGATVEQAHKKSNLATIISGGLNALVPIMVGGAVVRALGNKGGLKFFKKEIKQELLEEMSEESAEKVADTAAKHIVKTVTTPKIIERYVSPSIPGTILKRGATAGILESATELAQDEVAMILAGSAAYPEAKTYGEVLEKLPYTQEQIKNRRYNNAFLGFLGGKTAGTVGGTVEAFSDQDTVSRTNEILDEIDKLERSGPDLDNELANVIHGDYSNVKEKSGFLAGILGGLDAAARRSITMLEEMASRSPENKRVWDAFYNFYPNLSQRVGKYGVANIDASQPIKKTLKVPFTRPIKAKDNDAVFELLNNIYPNKKYTDAQIESARLQRKSLGTQIDDEIRIDKDNLINSVVDDTRTLRDIEDAIVSNRITKEDYNSLNIIYNRLKDNHRNERNNIQNLDITLQEKALGALTTKIKQDPDFKQLTRKEIAPPIGDGIIGDLAKVGAKVGFVDNYLTHIFKTGTKKRRQKIRDTLMSDPENFGEIDAIETVDNMKGNQGIYVNPDAVIKLEDPFEDSTVIDTEKGFQKPRRITQETFKKLYEEGLVETNVKKIIDRYALEAGTKVELKNLANVFNENIGRTRKADTVKRTEVEHMKDIFNAMQGQFANIRNPAVRDLQREFITYQYMLTLPLSALTSLTEPLIILSRTSNKNAIFGAIDAGLNGMRQLGRTVFPKISMREKERAFRSILEGVDGTLAERMGNIPGIDINRKVTDTFFKGIGLTAVTQASRDIGYQAGMRQMKEDLLDTLIYIKTKKHTKESIRAKKRLLEMGLTDNKINNQEIIDFAEGTTTEVPPLLQKAMARFVSEIVMAPNVINRPLWMSAPKLAMVAQLKGFMFVFGNTILPKIWRDIFKPMVQMKRLPVTEAVKYSITFGLIMAGTMGIQEIKDEIRNDGDGPWSKLSTFQKIVDAFFRSNILGAGTVLYDSAKSYKYGVKPLEVIAGPGLSWLSNAMSVMGQAARGSLSQMARFFANSVPIFSAVISGDAKDTFKDVIEDKLEDVKNIF
jgi:hypothetical protein